MKKTTIIIITFLLMIQLATAFDVPQDDFPKTTVNMKTTDYYLIQFEVINHEALDLYNCVPYVHTTYDSIRDYVTFNPSLFNMLESRQVSVRIEDVPPGLYEAALGVRCEIHFQGEFLEIRDIVRPNEMPRYEFLVSPAGEGQDYVFIPVQSYHFIANPGDSKQAMFTIANTGRTDLEVVISPEAEYQDQIKVVPSRLTIMPDQRRQIQIEIQTDREFTGMNTSLRIEIGDYVEEFPITGERERLFIPGGAVTQNLFQGTTSAGNIEIPNWIVLTIIIVLGAVLLRDELFKKKKTKRTKK